MRPSADELLGSLRVSLNDTVLPKVEDRWARYVAAAMDLVLQHLQLRLAGEVDALRADSADMAAVLARIGSRAAQLAETGDPRARRPFGSLVELLAGGVEVAEPADPAAATRQNEALRQQIVDVMRWLDEAEPDGATPAGRTAADEMRDEVNRLARRQTDRMKTFVEPLFMSFGPVAR